MNETRKKQVIRYFTSCLEANNYRKTSERFAILNTVYSMSGYFCLEELNALLEKQSFHVSRATIYNTIKLLVRFNLIVVHRIKGQTFYETCFGTNHCHQICTVCGQVTELPVAKVETTVETMRLRRFKKDHFTLSIYGVCSVCMTKQTKKNLHDDELK